MVGGCDHILLGTAQCRKVGLFENIFKPLGALLFYRKYLLRGHRHGLVGENDVEYVSLGYFAAYVSRRPQMVDRRHFGDVILFVDEILVPERFGSPGAGRDAEVASVSLSLYADRTVIPGYYFKLSLGCLRTDLGIDPVSEKRAQINADLVRRGQEFVFDYRTRFSLRHENRLFEEDAVYYEQHTWKWVALVFLKISVSVRIDEVFVAVCGKLILLLFVEDRLFDLADQH